MNTTRPVSPDGLWEWDGEKWLPRQAPQGSRGQGKPPIRWRPIVIAVAALTVLAAVGGIMSAVSPQPAASQASTTATKAATAAPTPSTAHSAAPPTARPTSTPKAAAPAPTAKPVPVAAFSVDGDASSGVDITYGSSSDNRQGGSSTPWSASLTVDGQAESYQVYAQLQGGGDITCSVKVGGVSKTGHASGGYNICQAEIVNFGGGWQPA